MKRKFNHPEPTQAELTGPRYWRSLDEVAQTPEFNEFLEKEFPSGASEMEGVNRRHFMKIMAASFAMAGVGMAGCRRPESHIMPYSKQPERVIQGVPVYYATSAPRAMGNIPLIVESHQNRPTKVEGNPKYSAYHGASDLFSQASVLDLYDVDRATRSSKGGDVLRPAGVNDLLAATAKKFVANKGKGLYILADRSTSPSRLRLQRKLKKAYPEAVWAQYEAIDQANPERATQRLFGQPLRPRYNLRNAKRILSIDCDFANTDIGSIAYTREFADGRRILNSSEADSGKMNRLYQVEPDFSVTGGMADHRLRLSTSELGAFAAALAAAVSSKTGRGSDIASALSATALKGHEKWITECVADLVEYSGKSVVVAGSHLPVEVHQLVYFINDLLGANGKTVSYLEIDHEETATIQDVAAAANRGEVDTLVVLNGNPSYDAPADLKWESVQEKIASNGTVIRYGYYFDETSLSASYHIAATHYLEAWSDGRTLDGELVPVQPLILPLFDGVSELEFLARLAGESKTDGYEIVYETFTEIAGRGNAEKAFAKFLNVGYLEGSGYAKASPKAGTSAYGDFSVLQAVIPGKDSLEIRFTPDRKVWDGRYNNNGWLQECPEPISKTTWDNAIIVSPRLALDLGYDTKTGKFLIGGVSKTTGDFEAGREVAPVARLTVDGQTVEGPIFVQPGLANYTVVLPLGYGRRKVGRVGQGSGFNVYPIRTSESLSYRSGAKIELTGGKYLLANTQMHWSMEGRAIVREADVDYYKEHSDFVKHMGMESHSPPIYGIDQDKSLQEKVTTQPRGNSSYKTPTFDPKGTHQQWGMVIDLNTCSGCNACVVACQSENNIPIVGKDQVTRGREMHWIRMDRYYASGNLADNQEKLPEDPQVVMQPMLCQHCEMAPCEMVCPVNATVHDEQGLNVMAYNRCVGTRYCANNCPYKVRRFNFFDWNKRDLNEFYKGPLGKKAETELSQMQKNPDVTVRMRGVIEKCTFCVQRIEEAKIRQLSKAKDSGNIKVPDGVIKVACQQACPAGAITFGDVSDASTEVSRLKASDRDYSVLGYLNTRPRTTYLAKLRNPNKNMPDFKDSGSNAYREYNEKNAHGHHDGAAASGEHKEVPHAVETH